MQILVDGEKRRKTLAVDTHREPGKGSKVACHVVRVSVLHQNEKEFHSWMNKIKQLNSHTALHCAVLCGNERGDQSVSNWMHRNVNVTCDC